MSLVEKYIGKNAVDVTFQDIIDFFVNEKEESDKIEFKAYTQDGNEREKENGVIRTICAFLNSGGGLLIWGAPLGQNIAGRTEKVFVGALSPVDKLIEKDYFINRVTDSITPAPNNVLFHTIEDNGNYVYIVEVLQSEYSPHQFKNTYYMRIDGQTKPAPHHYIEALFKKITFPKLKGFITLNRLYDDGRYFYMEITIILMNLSRLQNEHSGYYRVVVGRDAIFRNSQLQGQKKYFLDGHELRTIEPIDRLYYNQPYRFTDIVRLNPQEIQRRGGELDIYYYFAGEKSPMLQSTYKLRIDFNNIPQDLNTLFIDIDENRYLYDVSDGIGKTDEQRITELIGRQPS